MAASTESPAIIPEMVALATRIHGTSTHLSWFLASQPNPQPSLSTDTHISITRGSYGSKIAEAWRHQLKQDALDLFRLASTPEEYLAHVAMNHGITTSVRWLTQHRIFELVPIIGSVSYNNISVISSVSEVHLKAVCRMAISGGLFKEPEPDRIAHNSTSRIIATNADFGAWAECLAGPIWNASAKLGESSAQCYRSSLPTHSAFTMAQGDQAAFPDALRKDPKLAMNFGGFLKATGSMYANDLSHVVDGIDWEWFGKARVVDIGASSAALSLKLAEQFSDLVFEIATHVRHAGTIGTELHATSPDVSSKIALNTNRDPAAPPIFTSPVDVFILKHVLHHYPPPAALALLQHLAQHLTANGRIVIIDLVMPNPGTRGSYVEGMLRTRELVHLELSNGASRDEGGWYEFVERAGCSLEIIKVTRDIGSDLSIIEIRTSGEKGAVNPTEINGVN
ncbi:S-adenosyl-L-methionine-dependent methyltransferase [Pleomassaria siparia CBS 279.74]|uniref:S-adenosyl-L-methionine-dependent methyltransferase n=1 Tax=Pleomassaria siparia CBS 279.74 TaxID=1314801 RepID=A0A6G1JU45_9PLEO|nr:S-adenosyl-L-methionine-dependent methyltransferase [Pleomassaria siparia CBS 279.74]